MKKKIEDYFKQPLWLIIMLCISGSNLANAQSNKGSSGQKQPKQEIITKSISGSIEIFDTKTRQTSFKNTYLTVRYIKTTYYKPDGSEVPHLNFEGYRGYPLLTIEKVSFFNNQSFYASAICNNSGVYETEWLELKDNDENLKTYTWAKIIIRFKSSDFFSGNPYN